METITAKPTISLDAQRDEAAALRDAGNIEEALAAWKRAGEAGLADYVVGIESAVCELIDARFDTARERLAQLSENHPTNAPVRDLHAMALFECGKRKEAMLEWAQCLRHSAQISCPVSSNPMHLALASLAFERFLLENPEPPETTHTETDKHTVALHPPGHTAAARMRHIERALEQQRFDLALAWMGAETATDAAKPDATMGMLRALALGELGRYREAVDQLANMLKDDAENPPAQAYLGYCLAHAAEADLALLILDGVPPMGPDDYFAHFFRGVAHLARGERIAAIAQMRTAFSDFFFDNYFCVFVPLWEKMHGRY